MSRISKFDRVIAFTSHEIMDNYAIKFSIYNDTIHILDKDMSILIIDGYEVSIRPCEWDNLSEIFGPRVEHSTNSIEYRELMRFLSTVKMPLTELVSSDQDYYNFIKSHITSQAKSIKIYELLDQCREVIVNGKAGSNVLRYLLYKMNNRVIKWQYWNKQCEGLSNNSRLLVLLNIRHLLTHGSLESHTVLMTMAKNMHFAKCLKNHMLH